MNKAKVFSSALFLFVVIWGLYQNRLTNLHFWGAATNLMMYSNVNQPTKMASATEKA